MRVILGSILLFAAGAACADWQRPVVNLSRPGALDQVAQENPEHHALILGLIRTVQDRSCEEALKVHRASFDDGIRCPGAIMLMSYPPKVHLGFRLGGVQYMVRVPLNVPARRMPVE